jgi:hypothetical protein
VTQQDLIRGSLRNITIVILNRQWDIVNQGILYIQVLSPPCDAASLHYCLDIFRPTRLRSFYNDDFDAEKPRCAFGFATLKTRFFIAYRFFKQVQNYVVDVSNTTNFPFLSKTSSQCRISSSQNRMLEAQRFRLWFTVQYRHTMCQSCRYSSYSS